MVTRRVLMLAQPHQVCGSCGVKQRVLTVRNLLPIYINVKTNNTLFEPLHLMIDRPNPRICLACSPRILPQEYHNLARRFFLFMRQSTYRCVSSSRLKILLNTIYYNVRQKWHKSFLSPLL